MSQADPRYNKRRWKKQAQRTKQLTRNRCCQCGAKAREVHHAYYGIRFLCFTLPIGGFEIPGLQLFPLCANCHSNSKGCAHHTSNYRASKLSPWLNHNTTSYLWRLRIGFLLTTTILHPITTALIGFGLWLSASTIFASEFSAQSLLPQFQLWRSAPSRAKPENQYRVKLRNSRGFDRAPTLTP